MRRQLQYLRLYRPNLWRMGFLIAIVDFSTRLFLLLSAIAQTRYIGTALAALVALAVLDWISAELRLHASRRLAVFDTLVFRALNRLFAFTLLALPLVSAATIAASLFASRITWAHIRYTVDKTGRVLRVEHDGAERRVGR